MTAGLTLREDGTAEMAYLLSHGVPWHQNGNPMPDGASKEQWLEKSGANVRIQRGFVRYNVDAAGTQMVDEDNVVLFREDNKRRVGLVGKGFKVVQYRELLEPVFDLCEQAGYVLSAAGTLFGGERFWVCASLGVEDSILGGDVVKGYLTGVTAMDGSLKTTFVESAIRAICNNTVNAALAGGETKFQCSHKSVFNPDDMLRAMGFAKDAFGQFIKIGRQLAVTNCNMNDAKQLTAELLTETKTVTKEDVTASTGYKTILSLFDHGKGNHGETAWDWLNGVTEYVDHFQRAKTASHRMNNSLLGRGDALKNAAMEKALAFAAD